jgi:Uma2 family endonuclease
MKTTAAQPARKRKKALSEAEFLRLPDDGRKYELVDGEAKEVPAGFEHGVLAIRLAAQLLAHVHPWGYVCDSSTGFRMANGRIRSPDVSVVARTRLPAEFPKGFFEGAPDLAVEIVSPFEDMPDLLSKVGEYFASGAKQVWLLFPETQQAVIYHSPFDVVRLQAEDELSGGTLLPDFRVKVAALFERG